MIQNLSNEVRLLSLIALATIFFFTGCAGTATTSTTTTATKVDRTKSSMYAR